MSVYIVAGLVLGGVYAISALGLVLTYASSRVFNFGHGAIAFFIATTFYELNTRQGWPVWSSAALSLLVVAPALGVFLWAVLFRWLTHAPPAVKLVSTIGLYVAIPPLTFMIYGDEPIFRAPGLAGPNPGFYDVFGVTLNTDQIIVMIAAALVAAAMTVVLRFTSFGLSVRAVVDSPAMSSLVGTNTAFVAAASWAIGAFLAGLAGILVSPILNLDPVTFALLVVSSFAVVVIARLNSFALAFAGAILLGLAQQVSVRFLPSDGILSTGIRPSIPFLLMAAFLLIYGATGLGRDQPVRDTHSFDQGGGSEGLVERSRQGYFSRLVYPLTAVVLVLALPVLLNDFWVGLVAAGLAYSIIFLSFTVVTGDGGMISLCQVTFAGIGAITAAQLSGEHGWPVLPAILAGGLVAVPFGIAVAGLAVRLGGLYLGLATLAFALLMDNLVFPIDDFAQFGSGVAMDRPSIGGLEFTDDARFYYLQIVVFGLLALAVLNLRRSTTGLVLGAMRSSETATATTGYSVTRAKLTVFAISAFVAGVGGGLLASYTFRAHPPSFNALVGLVWLAITVTWGIRSIVGALLAGVLFAVLPQLIADYLPETTSVFGLGIELRHLPQVLFGLGAIALAREPRGVIVLNANLARSLRRRLIRPAARPLPAGEG